MNGNDKDKNILGTNIPPRDGSTQKIFKRFGDRIGEIRGVDAMPRVMDIGSLATATNWHEQGIGGEILFLKETGNPLDYVDVKFDKLSAPAIRFFRGTKIHTPFSKVYLSWPAQAGGSAKFIHGANVPELLDFWDEACCQEIANNTGLFNPDNGDIHINAWTTQSATGQYTLYTVPADYIFHLTYFNAHTRYNTAAGTYFLRGWNIVGGFVTSAICRLYTGSSTVTPVSVASCLIRPIIFPYGERVEMNLGGNVIGDAVIEGYLRHI